MLGDVPIVMNILWRAVYIHIYSNRHIHFYHYFYCFFFLSFVLFFFSLLFSHSFLVLYSTPTPRYRNQSFIRLIWISICRGWWLGNFVSSSKRYYLRQFVWNFAVAIAAAAVPARRIATQDCVWYMNNSKEHLEGYTWRTKKQIPNKCFFFCWPNVEIRSFGKSRMHTLMSAVAWIPHSFLSKYWFNFLFYAKKRFNSFYNCVELPVIEVIHVQEEWIEKYRKTKSSWETLFPFRYIWDSFVRINCCWQASESFENYKLFIKVKIKFHWGFWLFFHHRDRARRPLCSCVMAKHYPFFSAVVCISTSIQFE